MAPSTYYDAKTRAPSARAQRDDVLVASPRYQVHPELESGLFDPDSVDLAGHWGVGAPADGSVLGWRAVAQR